MVKEGEEQVFMGDSKSSPVIDKGKVLVKLTSGKYSPLVCSLCVRYSLKLSLSFSTWESRS